MDYIFQAGNFIKDLAFPHKLMFIVCAYAIVFGYKSYKEYLKEKKANGVIDQIKERKKEDFSILKGKINERIVIFTREILK